MKQWWHENKYGLAENAISFAALLVMLASIGFFLYVFWVGIPNTVFGPVWIWPVMFVDIIIGWCALVVVAMFNFSWGP